MMDNQIETRNGYVARGDGTLQAVLLTDDTEHPGRVVTVWGCKHNHRSASPAFACGRKAGRDVWVSADRVKVRGA